jgi:hypothetical protein
MLKTSFSKLEKHSPTNLYMLYPMVQSVARFCSEIDKKSTLQRHCPLSSSKRNLFRSLNYLNFEYVTHACQANTSAWTTVCVAKNTPACQPEALPARYRRTASLSTYTHMLLQKGEAQRNEMQRRLLLVRPAESTLLKAQYSSDPSADQILNLNFEVGGCCCLLPLTIYIYI